MLRTPPTDREAPTLTTERLRLRAHTLADFPTYCTLWADPAVMRFIGGKPNTAEESWARLLRNAGHWSLLGFGSWWVEERATGEFVGEVGLFNYQRTIDPPLGEIPEIGWILSPARHGRGYATEAVQAILSWADGRFIASEAACLIHPENAASLHVAEKCGFVWNRSITYRDSPAEVLVRCFNNQNV
jgi:RimJ/RimL family protein N-acetyltransferase